MTLNRMDSCLLGTVLEPPVQFIAALQKAHLVAIAFGLELSRRLPLQSASMSMGSWCCEGPRVHRRAGDRRCASTIQVCARNSRTYRFLTLIGCLLQCFRHVWFADSWVFLILYLSQCTWCNCCSHFTFRMLSFYCCCFLFHFPYLRLFNINYFFGFSLLAYGFLWGLFILMFYISQSTLSLFCS